MEYKEARVGQRVRYRGHSYSRGCRPSGITEGTTGTILVVGSGGDDYHSIGVQWDKYVSGHTLGGRSPNGYGYLMYPCAIELIDDVLPEIAVSFDDLF